MGSRVLEPGLLTLEPLGNTDQGCDVTQVISLKDQSRLWGDTDKIGGTIRSWSQQSGWEASELRPWCGSGGQWGDSGDDTAGWSNGASDRWNTGCDSKKGLMDDSEDFPLNKGLMKSIAVVVPRWALGKPVGYKPAGVHLSYWLGCPSCFPMRCCCAHVAWMHKVGRQKASPVCPSFVAS